MASTTVLTLDVNGAIIELSRAQGEVLRDAAAARAAASSQLRDLSLMLERALRDERVLVLRRAEARALLDLLSGQPEIDLAPVRQAVLNSLGERG